MVSDESITVHSGQVWRPATAKIAPRIIKSVSEHDGETLVRYASPRGKISRCTLQEMQTWIIRNQAVASTELPPPLAEPLVPMRLPHLDYLPFNPMDRTVLLIDGQHLHHLLRSMNTDVDFARMLEFFQRRCQLAHAHYYTSILGDNGEFSPLRKLADWLSYNGYLVTLDEAEEHYDMVNNRRRINNNVAMLIAVDLLMLDERIHHVIFFGGDGKYLPAIRAAKQRGTICSMVSLVNNINDNLRREADHFIDLRHIIEHFARPLRLRRDNQEKLAS